MDLSKYTGMPEWSKRVNPRWHCYSSYTPGRSIELKQLDESVAAAPETVDYLYSEFTPKRVDYVRGTRPLLEMIVDAVCADCKTARDKATALVRWRRANITHLGKCGLGTEEEIILGGYSMCHDASRTLITLAQVAGLGARMVIGLNAETGGGHTLTEIFVDDKWAIFDPSACIPWPFHELPDGTLANCWDIKQDPTIPTRSRQELVEKPRPGMKVGVTPERFAGFMCNYQLANYSLEESTRNMARRFVQLVTAKKIVDNYDYNGHLTSKRLSAFADLDQTVQDWLAATQQFDAAST